MIGRIAALAAILAVGGCASGASSDGRDQSAASAMFKEGFQRPLIDAKGAPIGTVTGTPSSDGLIIAVQARGLTPGEHGMHLHEVGRCDGPDFASAGGHWNTQGHKHGHDNPQGPHDGDLGNLAVGADGTGSSDRLIPRYHGMIPPAGLALVVHAGTDDEVTDPSGNSGARIACAVVLAPAS